MAELREVRLSNQFDESQVTVNHAALRLSSAVHKCEIVVKNLCLDVETKPFYRKTSQKVRLLSDISAVFSPGELVCLMGGSGAGKSTLLNALAGRSDAGITAQGSILVNGLNTSADFANSSCYVMQDDLLQPLLTVRESVAFSAKFRLPATMSSAEKTAKTEEILNRLNISLCGDTRIGGGNFKKGVSGGERKRASVAVEMINNPSVLFLDEPTSGLDSMTAASLVEMLRDLAREGHTVICTIHQPSTEVFFMFDKLLLLAKPGDNTGGRMAYYGPVSESVDFFERAGFPCPEHVNPADYFLKVCTPQVVSKGDGALETLNQEAISSVLRAFDLKVRSAVIAQVDLRSTRSFEEYGSNDPALVPVADSGHNSPSKNWCAMMRDARKQRHRPLGYDSSVGDFAVSMRPRISVLTEFLLLCKEHWLLQMRDPSFTVARLVSTIIIALLGGLVYLQLPFDQTGITNRQGSLFFFTIQAFMNNMLTSLALFPSNRRIFLREYDSGSYGSIAYYLAQSTLVLPLDLAFGLLYAVITYFMAGFQTDGFGLYLATLLLTVESSVSVAFFLSACVEEMQTALAVGTLLLIPMMLFGGFFVAPGTIPVWMEWFKYLSPFYYAFPVVIQQEMSGLAFYCDPSELQSAPPSLGCNASATYCPYTSGDVWLQATGLGGNDFLFNLGILAVLVVGFRLLGYILFKISIRGRGPK